MKGSAYAEKSTMGLMNLLVAMGMNIEFLSAGRSVGRRWVWLLMLHAAARFLCDAAREAAWLDEFVTRAGHVTRENIMYTIALWLN